MFHGSRSLSQRVVFHGRGSVSDKCSEAFTLGKKREKSNINDLLDVKLHYEQPLGGRVNQGARVR